MKPKLILCLAFILSGGLFGCSTAARHCCNVQSPKVVAVAKVKLKFVKVDSEETQSQDGHGENAVDGNPNTYWHTQWHGNSPGLPHEIIIELLPPSVIKGFTYLPRQDESDNGTIKNYEFYISDDGKNFGQPVKKGTFEPGKEEKIESFEPIKCRFIKLRATSEINGLPWTSAAEIRVIQSGENASVKDYWRGDIGPIPSRHDSNKPDAIDSFVAAFLANGGLWLNGVDGMDVLATSPQQVVSETLRTAHFESGMMTSYRIIDMRKVRIGEFGDYTAVLADTNLGEIILLMSSGSMSGHWWRRIYMAGIPYNRLY
jgi:F5/8 type C domain